jgi:acetyltransferase-like isoleucine patch superfamily enzyme
VAERPSRGRGWRGLVARSLLRVADGLDRRSLGPEVAAHVAQGADVTIGPDVRFVGPGRIVLGDGAWIGRGSRVLAGVEIGAGAVVRPYTVVHDDVPAGAVVHGNPARPVGSG